MKKEETKNLKKRKKVQQNKTSKQDKQNEEVKKKVKLGEFELLPTPIESTFEQIKENIDFPLCFLFILILLVLSIVFYKFEKEARMEENISGSNN